MSATGLGRIQSLQGEVMISTQQCRVQLLVIIFILYVEKKENPGGLGLKWLAQDHVLS